MYTHTQYLNILILLGSFNLISIAQMVKTSFKNYNKDYNNDKYYKSLVIIYLVILTVSLLMSPKLFSFKTNIKPIMFVLAIASGFIVIGLEISFVKLINILKGNKVVIKVKNLNVNKRTTSVLIVLLGILEELLFRMVYFNIFNSFKIPIILIVIGSSMFYAFNHITLGKNIFIQKLISGVFYAVLYLISGKLILVPIIAHAVQNTFISFYLTKEGGC